MFSIFIQRTDIQCRELRRAIDAVRVETAQQAMRRHDLAKRIAVDLEKRSLDMQIKQRAYWQEYYEPSARKLHDDQVRASRRRSVATEWKQEYKKLRYSLDSRRLQSMMPDPHFARGSHGGAPDFDTISEASVESPKAPHGLAKSWDELCSSSWQQEKDRCHSMEDSLSVFIDTLSMALETDQGVCDFPLVASKRPVNNLFVSRSRRFINGRTFSYRRIS